MAEPSGPDMGERWNKLTRTQHEVVELVAEGLTNRHVAQRLSISHRTVQRHLYDVFRKLGVTSRTQLVAERFRRQLEESSPESPTREQQEARKTSTGRRR